jgi:hypothetical protein
LFIHSINQQIKPLLSAFFDDDLKHTSAFFDDDLQIIVAFFDDND